MIKKIKSGNRCFKFPRKVVRGSDNFLKIRVKLFSSLLYLKYNKNNDKMQKYFFIYLIFIILAGEKADKNDELSAAFS